MPFFSSFKYFNSRDHLPSACQLAAATLKISTSLVNVSDGCNGKCACSGSWEDIVTCCGGKTVLLGGSYNSSPSKHEPDLLHGFMWLHTLKKPHSLHLASNLAVQMKHGSPRGCALFCMGSVQNLSPVWNWSGRTHVIACRIVSPSCWLLPAAVCDSREMLHDKWSQASAGHQTMVNWT